MANKTKKSTSPSLQASPIPTQSSHGDEPGTMVDPNAASDAWGSSMAVALPTSTKASSKSTSHPGQLSTSDPRPPSPPSTPPPPEPPAVKAARDTVGIGSHFYGSPTDREELLAVEGVEESPASCVTPRTRQDCLDSWSDGRPLALGEGVLHTPETPTLPDVWLGRRGLLKPALPLTPDTMPRNKRPAESPQGRPAKELKLSTQYVKESLEPPGDMAFQPATELKLSPVKLEEGLLWSPVSLPRGPDDTGPSSH
ncbi:hypothetical protein VTJ49DRAFT_4084 [Mycothermus thermophilus]|uniref:Uncharacterized protein n=1 Tax=Humicola insolens TaxID=85995 RepID=A0ABR3V6A0_HUMIN